MAEPLDDATRERWEALKAKLREKPPGRAYPKALDAIPDEDIFPTFRLRPDMNCSGYGKVAVKIGGKLCCPDCEMPIDGSEPASSSPSSRNEVAERSSK